MVCVSAASPLASSRALSLAEDVHGMLWERYGDMDMTTRKCAKQPESLPFRIVQFDIAESRLLADRYNLRSVSIAESQSCVSVHRSVVLWFGVLKG